MTGVRINTRVFPTGGGLNRALGDESFSKLPAPDQVAKLGKLFRDNIGSDEQQSVELMKMIRGAVLFASGNREISEAEILKISPYEMELMTKLSRKKIALSRFKSVIGKHFDAFTEEKKNELLEAGIDKKSFVKKSIKETFKQFSGVSAEVIDHLWGNYNLSYDVRMFLKAFSSDDLDSGENLSDICQCNGGVAPEFFMDLGMRLPFLGINSQRIRKEIMYEEDEVGRLTGNYLDAPVQENNIDNRNGFINPNWFLYDIDVEMAIKLWGIEKTKYIFGRYFHSGVEKMGISPKLHLPEFYNFCIFRVKIDEDAEGNKKKLVDLAQHIFEWEIPSDFTQAQFGELSKNLRSVISDLRSSGEPKRFDHPIQSRLGSKKYTGYFSGSKGFENTHLIDIQPVDVGGKRTLRFATEMGQDVTLFVMIQTSYFLKTRQFIPCKNLWREIYAMYNNLSMEGVERFDPISMKSQYDTLVQKVIWPLSKEHREKKGTIGKPHNALLYGVYGTGKSQLLTHLLAEREYKLKNGDNVHLEANVINIGIMEFAELLVKSVSGFRKRLSDIHENTGFPVVLVIEDIDTIVKEAGLDSDPVSQALTTLFEGVGSLPVTVIASTNNPEILPQRHLRPNRIDTFLGFSYPLSHDILRSIFQAHWKKKGLKELLKDILDITDLEEEILEKTRNFTPSHISAFCLSVYEALEFENIELLGSEGIKKIIMNEIVQCPVPVKDMNARQESMKKWKQSLSSDGGSMGFGSGK